MEDVGGSTLDEYAEITAAVSTVMGRLDTDSEEGIGMDEFMCVGREVSCFFNFLLLDLFFFFCRVLNISCLECTWYVLCFCVW